MTQKISAIRQWSRTNKTNSFFFFFSLLARALTSISMEHSQNLQKTFIKSCAPKYLQRCEKTLVSNYKKYLTSPLVNKISQPRSRSMVSKVSPHGMTLQVLVVISHINLCRRFICEGGSCYHLGQLPYNSDSLWHSVDQLVFWSKQPFINYFKHEMDLLNKSRTSIPWDWALDWFLNMSSYLHKLPSAPLLQNHTVLQMCCPTAVLEALDPACFTCLPAQHGWFKCPHYTFSM